MPQPFKADAGTGGAVSVRLQPRAAGFAPPDSVTVAKQTTRRLKGRAVQRAQADRWKRAAGAGELLKREVPTAAAKSGKKPGRSMDAPEFLERMEESLRVQEIFACFRAAHGFASSAGAPGKKGFRRLMSMSEQEFMEER